MEAGSDGCSPSKHVTGKEGPPLTSARNEGKKRERERERDRGRREGRGRERASRVAWRGHPTVFEQASSAFTVLHCTRCDARHTPDIARMEQGSMCSGLKLTWHSAALHCIVLVQASNCKQALASDEQLQLQHGLRRAGISRWGEGGERGLRAISTDFEASGAGAYGSS